MEKRSLPSFMSKDGRALQASRVFTDTGNKTHIGSATYKGVLVQRGETSIVPPGCTRYVEGPATMVLLRSFAPKFTTTLHTDPAQQHQLIFTIDGTATGEAEDGTPFHLKPGDITSVEDSVGGGHSARDEGGTGFIQLFIARPANI
jgi:quercetin dioxygenase-like cupin family protein